MGFAAKELLITDYAVRSKLCEEQIDLALVHCQATGADNWFLSFIFPPTQPCIAELRSTLTNRAWGIRSADVG